LAITADEKNYHGLVLGGGSSPRITELVSEVMERKISNPVGAKHTQLSKTECGSLGKELAGPAFRKRTIAGKEGKKGK